ncbi:hypothetical protein IPJ72_05955 [Candidatus Peregrinibacteria bacterium]|nr:MAG: hypothetical protein IPJ72_05955 [Candidatus Peregrinibacteria bacterium]
MIGTSNHWKPFYDESCDMISDRMLKGERVSEILESYPHMDVESCDDYNGVIGSVFFQSFNGHAKWLRFHIKYLRNLKGKVIGIIETVEDITEQKENTIAIARANTNLEIRVKERTMELLNVNEKLQKEVLEREQVANALFESEAKSQALLNAIPDMMFHLTKYGICLDYKTPKMLICRFLPTAFWEKMCFNFCPPNYRID